MLSPMQGAATMDDIGMFGVSPPPSPKPSGPSEEDEHRESKEATQAATESKEVTKMLQVQRDWPFFTTLESCTRELNLRWVKTEHGGKNNCLLYSYSVASGEMHHREQKTKCALHCNVCCPFGRVLWRAKPRRAHRGSTGGRGGAPSPAGGGENRLGEHTSQL